ncbi:MAG: cobyrinate a,c-diamide synthase [Alphaproteobacteria bacterium]|nr:cobyrinate a,c-diamide synthase [Alphaproteobacteria bacterium]
MTKGLVIAAPASGAGKTTITLGLVRALRDARVRVAAAKAGPDYIDPAFLAAAAGRPAPNLDVWAMRQATLEAVVDGLGDARLVVVEGVMGLFDGIGAAGLGSTAELAQSLGWPVILVLDARGAATSVAAMLRGFVAYRPSLTIAGAIVNRVGSASHAALVTEACRAACPHVKILGAVPRDPALVVPERHLGLVQAAEHASLDAFIARAAARVAENVDLAALQALAERALPQVPEADTAPFAPLGQRIAIAGDVAFAFRYPHLLDAWHAAGAELVPFSPLADQAPDPEADAVYLPGGYPELHAGRLAANRTFLDGLRAAAARGATVFGECGGYMVLGRSLIDADGAAHAMAGLLPLVTSFADRALHLGYRQITLARATALGDAGAEFRGHEFHYARVIEETGDPLFTVTDALGARAASAGLVSGSVCGSFLHLIDRA